MKKSIFIIGLSLLFSSLLLSQNVWVLSNNDPDFQNPPFDDSLKVFSPDGTLLMERGNFGIFSDVSGARTLTVSPDGQSCWINNMITDSLLKIDIQGNILLRISVPGGLNAIDIAETGLVYCLTDAGGSIYGDSIVVRDQQGNYLRGAPYGGHDIALDVENASVWVVGRDIKRLNLDLEHQFTIDPIGWVATSVDYASDGTAWIGNGLHSQVPDSKNQLLHIDQNGTVLDSVDFAFRPNCVRVDRSDGSVWIASDSLYKYTPSQHQLDGIVYINCFTLSIDNDNDLIWVATYTDVRSYTKDGALQTVIDRFDGSCQRHVSLPRQIVVPPDMSLIAHYPLRSHANDSTGNNTPMTLTNTPFQDGGIYCNGNYFTSPSCGAVTPYINNFNFDSFAIKAKFKVSEYPTGRRPVFVGGGSNRWLAYYLDHNGTITLKYNNNNYETSDVTYSLDTWHEATITYIDSVAKLYLDNVLAISYKFAMNHGNDNNVGITDFANGNIFKGIFSDLRIYSGDVETKVEENTSGAVPESFTLYQNYPNPFNASTKISFDIPDRSMTTLTIYDIMGHEVKTLINEVKEKGRHQVVWNGDNNAGQNVSSGLYMYRLRSGDTIESHKMLLIR